MSIYGALHELVNPSIVSSAHMFVYRQNISFIHVTLNQTTLSSRKPIVIREIYFQPVVRFKSSTHISTPRQLLFVFDNSL